MMCREKKKDSIFLAEDIRYFRSFRVIVLNRLRSIMHFAILTHLNPFNPCSRFLLPVFKLTRNIVMRWIKFNILIYSVN